MVLDDVVAVPEGSAWLDDDLDSCCFGCFGDGLVARTGVCICVLFEDEMGWFPGFEEFWEECLRSFSEDEQLGIFVQLCDGLREVILAVQSDTQC